MQPPHYSYFPQNVGLPTLPLTIVGGIVLITSAYVLFRWTYAARAKLREISDNTPSLLMKRVRLSDGERRTMRSSLQMSQGVGTKNLAAPPQPQYRYLQLAHSLDLTPSYIKKMRRDHGLEVMSLGEYLSSLRPAGPTKAASLKDVELLIGAALLRALGPSVGTALLPVLGVLPKAVKAAAGVSTATRSLMDLPFAVVVDSLLSASPASVSACPAVLTAVAATATPPIPAAAFTALGMGSTPSTGNRAVPTDGPKALSNAAPMSSSTSLSDAALVGPTGRRLDRYSPRDITSRPWSRRIFLM